MVRRRLGNSQKGRPFSEFISFNDTQKAAKAAGVSVGEFLERRHVVGNKTALEVTFEGLTALGVFDGKLDRICEIGPGSGRYLEKTMSLCNPAHYEIYETSAEWRKWLAEKYGVTTRQSDWRTLGETEAASVDLVQAHKVFPGLPLLTTISYFREMARVARNGGWIVFDVMTETCFDVVNLQAWFDANPWEWEWSPRMCSFEYVVNMFESLGVTAIGNFLVPLYPGVTQCLVFRKTIPQEKLSNPVKSGR
ncbi:MAG TPA: methyltransferase domain-containing protein [Terracidiphilus sp.]|nr:methyltransferase domain-containing protein [Terracidiphilus sp.]